jgi:hypothetical protein
MKLEGGRRKVKRGRKKNLWTVLANRVRKGGIGRLVLSQ